jgi:hypothetical protein
MSAFAPSGVAVLAADAIVISIAAIGAHQVGARTG